MKSLFKLVPGKIGNILAGRKPAGDAASAGAGERAGGEAAVIPPGMDPNSPYAQIMARSGRGPLAGALETDETGDLDPPEAPATAQPASEARGLIDFVYLSRLALAMVFVGALAYDLKAALALAALALPLVAALGGVIVVRRILAARRMAEEVGPEAASA